MGAEDGVSIPCGYVSSLQPVSCARLWEEARHRGGIENLEMGYVVQLHRAFYPTEGPKDCFSFQHPNFARQSNERYVELEFTIDVDTMCHGFAGYFDCQLYGKARMSIHPGTHSEDMHRWFPMWFPLATPVFLKKGIVVKSNWWRRVDYTKVWYEWCLSEPMPSPLQNPGGRSYSIGL